MFVHLDDECPQSTYLADDELFAYESPICLDNSLPGVVILVLVFNDRATQDNTAICKVLETIHVIQSLNVSMIVERSLRNGNLEYVRNST